MGLVIGTGMYLQHDEVQALAPSSDKTQQLGGFADEKTQSTHEILNSLWLAKHASMMPINFFMMDFSKVQNIIGIHLEDFNSFVLSLLTCLLVYLATIKTNFKTINKINSGLY